MRNSPRNNSMLRSLHRPLKAARQQTLLSRRFVIAAFLRLPLIGGLAMFGQRALAARRRPRDQVHVAVTIAAIIDHLLPGGELPGARALGIDRRIAGMTDEERRHTFANGVAWLDARARMAGASSFLALDEAGKEAALQAALASGRDGGGTFLREVRNLAFTTYYTHPTVMAAFAYSGPPQPDGFPDFQEAPR